MERGPLSSALCAWAQAQGVWAGPPLLVAWAAARRQELPFGEHLARGTVLTFARRGGGGVWSWHRCPSGVPRLLARGCSLQGAFVS